MRETAVLLKQIKERLKGVVTAKFVDDFFTLRRIEASPNELCVRFDVVAEWLVVEKYNLKQLLMKHFVSGVDYDVKKPFTGRGVGKLEVIMLTSNCFKNMCLRSTSKNADQVRTYFIFVENEFVKLALDKVKVAIASKDAQLAAKDARIAQLENNQRGPPPPSPMEGVIYVIDAEPEGFIDHAAPGWAFDKARMKQVAKERRQEHLKKIGRTVNSRDRMASHNRALADKMHTLFTYHTNDVVAVENCVKQALKGRQYMRHREVYEIDLAILRKVIKSCGRIFRLVALPLESASKASAVSKVGKGESGDKQAGGGVKAPRLFMVIQRTPTASTASTDSTAP